MRRRPCIVVLCMSGINDSVNIRAECEFRFPHAPVSCESEPADGRRVGAADVRHVAGGRRSRGRDLSVTGR